jgi:SAM-dependent methyltransferase
MGSERPASSGAAELEDRLTAQALADGDPAGWFERFYRAAAAGEVELPWQRAEPHWLLTRWAAQRRIDGSARRAIVVGCGQGTDAEYVTRLGFHVVAFDIAETAIRLARQRYPDSAVHYQAADLLNPPSEWWHAFDLVVEIITVQALPDPPQRQAIVNVGRLVGPGGTLLAVEAVREEHERAPELGPWPLSRADINVFATDGLIPIAIDLTTGPEGPADVRWLAEFRRPRGLSPVSGLCPEGPPKVNGIRTVPSDPGLAWPGRRLAQRPGQGTRAPDLRAPGRARHGVSNGTTSTTGYRDERTPPMAASQGRLHDKRLPASQRPYRAARDVLLRAAVKLRQQTEDVAALRR